MNIIPARNAVMAVAAPSPAPSADLAGLRARVRVIEGSDAAAHGVARFGVRAVDGALPWGGLPRGALHEAVAMDAGAGTGFAAALAGRLARDGGGAVLWCVRAPVLDAGGLYAPGLGRGGLDPGRVVVVHARRDADALWAMEEGLRCPGLAAVVGEVAAAALTATRRLQLAAEAGGVTALLVRPRAWDLGPSAALTRWRVAAAPAAGEPSGDRGGGLGPPRWDVELFRCRGGSPRRWAMEWHDETGDFAVAAPVRDRPAVPQPARLAG